MQYSRVEVWRLLRANDLLVKSLEQSSRKGIRPCFCETKVSLGKVGVLSEGKDGGTSVR